jgi:hypothetical protein
MVRAAGEGHGFVEINETMVLRGSVSTPQSLSGRSLVPGAATSVVATSQTSKNNPAVHDTSRRKSDGLTGEMNTARCAFIDTSARE